MTVDPVAVWCGSVSLTETELRERVRGAAVEHGFATHTLVPILDGDPVAALVRALAARSAGAIPLLGDDRWSADYWARLCLLADGAAVPADTAWAAFTSGSSGSPRVILRSEESWSTSFGAVTELMQLGSGDAVYLPAPLSSSLSLYAVAHARAAGAAIVLPRSHGVSRVDLEHVTAVHGTPNALRTVVEALEGEAGPHGIRNALVGGAHLDPGLRRRAEALGIRVVSYYGAAELSFVTVDQDGLGHRAFPGAELRIDAGEVWVRSPYLASGYLGADGALREAPGGWATVGDLVELDDAERMHFRGRADGAILTAAATVIPEDVESALRTIDGVEDAVVFGIDTAGVGALVGAIIETTPGRAVPSAHDLREQARTRLSPSHLPRRWYWTEKLPRTYSGKPARAGIGRVIDNGEVTRLD